MVHKKYPEKSKLGVGILAYAPPRQKAWLFSMLLKQLKSPNTHTHTHAHERRLMPVHVPNT